MKEKDITHFRKALKLHLSLLAERYQTQSLGIFGSYVRREQQSDSDLDVLVSFSETPSLLKFIALENHLSDLLGVKVDLVMQDALKPSIGQRILREVIIYDDRTDIDQRRKRSKSSPAQAGGRQFLERVSASLKPVRKLTIAVVK